MIIHLNEMNRCTSDCYPFVMQMPGRNYSADSYRYGFNGMEKDDEVKGSGNHYTAFWRQYDPRLGKFMTLDPAMSKYAGWSPYSFAFNNPIWLNDPDGDDPYKRKKRRALRKYKRKYNRALRKTDGDVDAARDAVKSKNGKKDWWAVAHKSPTGFDFFEDVDELYHSSKGGINSDPGYVVLPIEDGAWQATEENHGVLTIEVTPLSEGGVLTIEMPDVGEGENHYDAWDQDGNPIAQDIKFTTKEGGTIPTATVNVPKGTTTEIRVVQSTSVRNETRTGEVHDVVILQYRYSERRRKKAKELPRINNHKPAGR